MLFFNNNSSSNILILRYINHSNSNHQVQNLKFKDLLLLVKILEPQIPLRIQPQQAIQSLTMMKKFLIIQLAISLLTVIETEEAEVLDLLLQAWRGAKNPLPLLLLPLLDQIRLLLL